MPVAQTRFRILGPLEVLADGRPGEAGWPAAARAARPAAARRQPGGVHRPARRRPLGRGAAGHRARPPARLCGWPAPSLARWSRRRTAGDQGAGLPAAGRAGRAGPPTGSRSWSARTRPTRRWRCGADQRCTTWPWTRAGPPPAGWTSAGSPCWSSGSTPTCGRAGSPSWPRVTVLVREHPLRERLWEQLMLALHSPGGGPKRWRLPRAAGLLVERARDRAGARCGAWSRRC